LENSFKFIKSTFLELTSKTYPYGYEDMLVRDMIDKGNFPKLKQDAWGNYFHNIGNSRTVFASHFDTACKDQVDVKHLINKQQIVTTNGTSILGADDKAGVTVMLWMIKNNIPGLYYFFIGEEVGCVGSSSAAPQGDFFGKYDRVISFDRRGTNSVITHQSSYRCCSDEFGKSLASQLNVKSNLYYKLDDTGVYTDSAEFVDYVPECTNLSVGYLNEHTTRESQDLFHLNKLSLAVLGVDWGSLPVVRDMSKRESKWDSLWDKNKKVWDISGGDDDYSYGWGSKKKDKYLNDDSDYDTSTSRHHKTRRGLKSKRKPQSYFDGGGGKLTIFENSRNIGKFDVLTDKFLISDLTKDELDSLRNQHFDMESACDRKEYYDIESVHR
jgi:hypothetical protein